MFFNNNIFLTYILTCVLILVFKTIYITVFKTVLLSVFLYLLPYLTNTTTTKTRSFKLKGFKIYYSFRPTYERTPALLAFLSQLGFPLLPSLVSSSCCSLLLPSSSYICSFLLRLN